MFTRLRLRELFFNDSDMEHVIFGVKTIDSPPISDIQQL